MAILKLVSFGDAMHSFILATWCHIAEDCNLCHLKYVRLSWKALHLNYREQLMVF